MSRGWPVLGIDDAGALVAAANVSPPQMASAPPALARRFETMRAVLGEAAGNLDLYRHFGYRVVGQRDADDLRTWTLFRPDDR